jgi:nucleoside-diphosphate-sugar epimerase/glycosyltransferase involved in cell wall biosynthesis
MSVVKTDHSSSKSILVIGGSGYLGQSIIAHALKNSFKVSAISRNKPKSLDNKITFNQVDITDLQSVQSFLDNKNFDYVINCGGCVDHSQYSENGQEIIETHLIGVINLASVLRSTKIKNFINIGSSWEYGMSHGPHRESLREQAYTPYAYAKTSAAHFLEMLFRNEGFPGTTLRCFLTFGPGQKVGLVPTLIQACLLDKEFPCSDGQSVRDLLYIDDFLEAVFACFDNKKILGETLNIGRGVPIKVAEVIQLATTLTQGGKPLYGEYRPHKIENPILFADTDKAQKKLDWSPKVSLRDGMEKTIAWHKPQYEDMNETQPLISIIINCFNGERYLQETLNSVQAQTYKNFEVIFWDNQSSDSTAKIYKKFNDPRFKYFLSSEHTNLYTARAAACEASCGEFLAFLDADDYWTNDKLEKQVKLFADPEVGFSCSNFRILHELKQVDYTAHTNNLPSGYVEEDLAASYFIGLLTLMVRAEAYKSLPYGFDRDFHVMGDLDLTFRLSKKWKLASTQEVLGTCRKHGNNALVLMRSEHISEFEAWLERKVKEKDFFSTLSEVNLLSTLNYMKFLYLILNKRRKQAFKLVLNERFLNAIYIRCIIMLFLPLKVIHMIKND